MSAGMVRKEHPTIDFPDRGVKPLDGPEVVDVIAEVEIVGADDKALHL